MGKNYTSALRNPTRGETRAWLDDYSEQYGAIPEGEKAGSRGDQNIPQAVSDDGRTRQTVCTYLEAISTPDSLAGELERDIAAGRFEYRPVSNKAANEYADLILGQGIDEVFLRYIFMCAFYKH